MTSYDQLKKLDAICDAFEVNWSESSVGIIAERLQEVDANQRSELLKQLLWVDLDIRLARGFEIDFTIYEKQLSVYGDDAQSAYAEYMNRRSINDTSRVPATSEATKTEISTSIPLLSNTRLGKYFIETCDWFRGVRVCLFGD